MKAAEDIEKDNGKINASGSFNVYFYMQIILGDKADGKTGQINDSADKTVVFLNE